MNMWDHVVAAVICIIALILAYTSRRVRAEEIQLEPEDKVRLYHNNAMLLAVFALIVITLWRIPGRSFYGLGFERPYGGPMVTALVILVFVFYALDIFFQYGLKRWRIKSLERKNPIASFVPIDRRELFHFIFLALAAGVGEEIIFRGYLIHYLVFWTGNSTEGIITACLISSALFAFLHGYQGLRSMIKIFLISLCFAAIFVYSQSLFIVIIIHTLIDVIGAWLGISLLKNVQQSDSPSNED